MIKNMIKIRQYNCLNKINAVIMSCSLSLRLFFCYCFVVRRVRDSLRVDPIGTEVQAMANHALRQRQYSVPAPNAMWHIDGNHK